MKTKLNNGFYISLDFELFWGLDLPIHIPNEKKDLFKRTRNLVPDILSLFSKYKISATWAIVGLLLTSDLEGLDLRDESVFPNYKNPLSRNFKKIEKIISADSDFSFLNCIELAKQIFNTENQEIATHTFSHYYCLESGQLQENFYNDLKLVNDFHLKIFNKVPESIVFPRNQINYLDILRENGYKFYRGTQKHWAYNSLNHNDFNIMSMRIFRLLDMYLPLFDNTFDINKSNNDYNNLININQSRLLLGFIKSRRIIENLRIKRIKNSMLKAAKSGKSYHLWWHPHNFGAYPSESLKMLDSILKYFIELRNQYDFKSLNMSQATK